MNLIDLQNTDDKIKKMNSNKLVYIYMLLITKYNNASDI